MKVWILALASVLCAGCTMVSLQRETLGQSGTVIDLRYREIMDDLAMTAHDPSSLPAFSTIFVGTSQVADTGQIGASAVWQHVVPVSSTSVIQNGLQSEIVSPQVNRTILQNWSLDPIIVPEKIEALRCACQWVIYGPEQACRDCPGLLASPDQAAGPGRHFGVADRLAQLPAGWIRTGKFTDVPLNACYKASFHGTWVWVTPEGMHGLAAFALIVQDIARVDSNSPTLFAFPPNPAPLRFRADSDSNKECIYAVTVALDIYGHLVPPQTYYRGRVDNTGSDASLRSQINAAGSH
jgi:hypothetical protein